MNVLVTGATGFIGSHTCVQLLNAGYSIIAVDNLVNSKLQVVDQIQKITGKQFLFYEHDLAEVRLVEEIFRKNHIDAVIHFAGLKAVGESVEDPLRYYENNLFSTLNILKVMDEFKVRKFVFSSSATVYGDPQFLPIKEECIRSTTNPYGTTKLMIEQIIQDLSKSNPEWDIALLRYFNPVGAHKSGTIGEDPQGIPNNLVPYIVKVALGEMDKLFVYGNDYDTKDGTGVRDYIHVEDLARGHIDALEFLSRNAGLHIYNLGAGTGYSVLDVINTFERVNHVKIPHVFVSRRWGDVAACYADSSKAERELGWKAVKTLEDMCRDTWNFAKLNRGNR